VDGVSFDVRGGEIVGLAGLVGAGRSELAHAIYGASPTHSGGAELLDARPWHSPRGALGSGIALIPESRQVEGLMPGRPVRENVSLAYLPALSRLGVVRRRHERRQVSSSLGRTTVLASPEQLAGTLSGGNQQKLLFARAILIEPSVLLADEPTRGIDVGAKRDIYEVLVRLAGDGMAILLISNEVEEILGLAHRVLVMRAGRLVAELEGPEMTEEAIVSAAFGTARTSAA
jgi:simple sugar transport system ATP-binding protein/ribose transport system ATP-binding protein